MYGYEWTEENGIFRLTINAKIQKEIRPVFHEELDFFGMDQYWDYPKDTTAPLLWAEGVRRYVLNGVCVAEAQGGGFYTKPTIKRLTEERLKLVPIDTDRLYEVNRQIMLSLEQKAVQFIQTQYEHYLPLGFSFVCAFSGGKDSLVLLDLMTKALAPKDYYVVFSNTGMELSDTLKTFVDAQKHWPGVRFKEAKCHMDMEESWNEFGPPASKLRWCCSVRKSVPTLMLLSELTGKDTKAVVFDGVRAEESLRRSKYTEVGEGVKNIQQVNCHAILKWSSAEIFVYALKKNVLLNNAYRHGIYRVGCKVCPMSAKWQDSLISFNYPDEVKSQLRMLEDMTLFAKGKIDKKYIEDGGWQARAGGKILKQGENRVSEEITATSIAFRIKNARQNWNSVLPIWGIPVDDDGKRITVKTKHGNFEMNYREENGQQIVSISPFFQLDRFDISTLRSIANKTAYCVGCKACTPQCPTGAYQIIDGKIVIRANRCVHCYNCCTYTDKGCMVAKSLFVRGENMENPDKYRNFGFRQSFYSHFVDTGVDCFDLPDQDKVLGKDQYKALKQWVAESGILKIETKGSKKVVLPELTVLGNKLINIGVYNPFGWAVMWANLAYNSIVVNAFCLNIGVGETFNKDDIVGILKYDNATACDHAANSLLSTFRDSPIGSSLMQGIQLDKDYYRAGWEYPHAVALLYALYLYDVAEKWQNTLLRESENWGIVTLCWMMDGTPSKPKGLITMIGYKPFCPYDIDLEFYRDARSQFSIHEWIDVIIEAIDYNPDGYLDENGEVSERKKLYFLRRLLPFVEKRVNLIELAPKGTGKSYVFEKISKRGWLISGGTVSRASLIYDNAKKTGGLLTRFDFVGFDEVQSITFEQPGQIQQALKHYMEYGEIKGFDASLSSGAGVIVLGNIDADRFDTNKNMVANISEVFGESATLDRFHGFIPGWEIPRMTTGMIAKGWAINTEYFAEVMHALRDDLTYSAVVDAMIDFPSNADKRHMTAIKRLCTAFLKLLFPHVQTPNDIDRQEFIDYCLNPAIEMRSAIYKQLCIIDAKEYDVPSKRIPEIVCK